MLYKMYVYLGYVENMLVIMTVFILGLNCFILWLFNIVFSGVAGVTILSLRNRCTSLLPSAGIEAGKSCKAGAGAVNVNLYNFFTFTKNAEQMFSSTTGVFFSYLI